MGDGQTPQTGIEKAATFTRSLGSGIMALVVLLTCGCCLWTVIFSK